LHFVIPQLGPIIQSQVTGHEHAVPQPISGPESDIITFVSTPTHFTPLHPTPLQVSLEYRGQPGGKRIFSAEFGGAGE